MKKIKLKSIKKFINYIINSIERVKFKKNVLAIDAAEEKFTWIYKNNYWGYESVSGAGSTIRYTQNIRKELPNIISQFKIKTVLDAPCGDFNWMKVLLPELNINYIGGDIVKELIASHNLNYSDKKTKFIALNLITDPLPNADLMLCRDCLFHFSYDDIRKFLLNFSKSQITYLLTTTHKNTSNFRNRNIQTGDFRLIDLFSAPFNFPNTPLSRIEDWLSPEPEREMCLFSREHVNIAIRNFNVTIN